MRQPKQQRAVQTREAILRAAAAVFDELGYSGASINRILERAGTTAGALYFHFKSKEGLAHAVMHAQPETIVPMADSHGLQRVVDVTLVWAYQLQVDLMLRAGVRLTTEQTTFGMEDASGPYQQWAQIMEEYLREAADRGELQAGVDPRELAEYIVESCTGMQLYSAAVSGREDLMDRVLRMWRLLLPGIAVPAVAVRTRVDRDRVRPVPAVAAAT
ncbi:ScbR family autoregulator-binding transcription factor [Streptomyces sp. NPDC101151]|uniref:ScbR family autoregulator-binding transcription factor n=1 Tax=Streptomyces sp. NPDC101151 TaxID=3366115 RepID=UPI00380EF8F0